MNQSSSLAVARAEDGTRLAYRLDGREGAPAIVFSNSIGTTHRMWDRQVELLGSRYRILRYDVRGHGESDAPPGPYSLDLLAGDALAIIAHAGLSHVTFCGLSLGGLVGQWLGANVARAPHVVDRLVLANTAPRFAPRTLWDGRIGSVTSDGMISISQGAIARWFTPEFAERDPQTVAAFRARFEALVPNGYAGCCAVLRDCETRDLMPQVALPTLVIVGERDLATPPALGEEIAAAIPHAKLVSLDAPHLSSVERAPEFAAALAAFVAETAAA